MDSLDAIKKVAEEGADALKRAEIDLAIAKTTLDAIIENLKK